MLSSHCSVNIEEEAREISIKAEIRDELARAHWKTKEILRGIEETYQLKCWI